MGLVTVVFVTVVGLLGPEIQAVALSAACSGSDCGGGTTLVARTAPGGHLVVPGPTQACVDQPSCGGGAAVTLAAGAALLGALGAATAAGLFFGGRRVRRRRPARSALSRGRPYVLLRPPRFA